MQPLGDTRVVTAPESRRELRLEPALVKGLQAAAAEPTIAGADQVDQLGSSVLPEVSAALFSSAIQKHCVGFFFFKYSGRDAAIILGSGYTKWLWTEQWRSANAGNVLTATRPGRQASGGAAAGWQRGRPGPGFQPVPFFGSAGTKCRPLDSEVVE